MMLPEPSSQVLAVRFGLVVGEREWSGGTERSEWDYYLDGGRRTSLCPLVDHRRWIR
jgi:hypothetical protein